MLKKKTTKQTTIEFIPNSHVEYDYRDNGELSIQITTLLGNFECCLYPTSKGYEVVIWRAVSGQEVGSASWGFGKRFKNLPNVETLQDGIDAVLNHLCSILQDDLNIVRHTEDLVDIETTLFKFRVIDGELQVKHFTFFNPSDYPLHHEVHVYKWLTLGNFKYSPDQEIYVKKLIEAEIAQIYSLLQSQLED